MATIFFSYSHKDEILRNELEVHLSALKREGLIATWHDRRIVAGDHLADTIDAHMNLADLILLLVSPDFLASDYCYNLEMSRAMERNASNQARVIPVILRPCDWTNAPFGKLLATPQDGKPVTKWADRDEAFLDITKSIRVALAQANTNSSQARLIIHPSRSSELSNVTPRSSNLRIRQNFSEVDKDQYVEEAFEYMAKFFEASLSEIEQRHVDLKSKYRRISSQSFAAIVYRDGNTAAECAIHLTGSRQGEIRYTSDSSGTPDSYNESLRVEVGEQSLHLRPLGMSFRHYGRDKEHLSFEGAAEYFWSIFMEPLQQ